MDQEVQLPLEYEYSIEKYIDQLKDNLLRANYTVHDFILYFYNSNCPRCQRPLRISRGKVTNGGSISVYMPIDKPKEAYLYCPCKSCEREIQRIQHISLMRDPRFHDLESFVTRASSEMEMKS